MCIISLEGWLQLWQLAGMLIPILEGVRLVGSQFSNMLKDLERNRSKIPGLVLPDGGQLKIIKTLGKGALDDAL